MCKDSLFRSEKLTLCLKDHAAFVYKSRSLLLVRQYKRQVLPGYSVVRLIQKWGVKAESKGKGALILGVFL